MREALLDDLTKSNVPLEFISEILNKSDHYFSDIYIKLKDELVKRGISSSEAETRLKEIFGNYQP